MLNNLNQEIKVCAIIPFYNEEDFLTDVVTETLEYVDKVFAVDDGSSDNSTEKINYFDRVQLISLDRNYGKGYALQSGFDEAIVQGFDIIITLDADKQHNPEFIPDFLSKAAEYDIVIGNRLNDIKIMPIQRVFSNTITSRLLSIKTGQKILDSQCGFRAYRSRVIKKVKSHSFGYEAESEMIIYAAKAGFRIGFTKISTIYGDEKSKMNSFKAISGFVKILFR